MQRCSDENKAVMMQWCSDQNEALEMQQCSDENEAVECRGLDHPRPNKKERPQPPRLHQTGEM